MPAGRSRSPRATAKAGCPPKARPEDHVAKLIYSAITSLDGYVADEDGNFDWAAPDEEVHAFVNDLERPIGTYLYGRRMYEVMVYWETAHLADQPPVMQDYAEIWQAADKVVYSKTLETVVQRQDADRARLRPRGRPAAESGGGPRHQRWRPRASPPRRSRPGWSTSATCSSRRSWWAAASAPCPTMSAWSSSCSTSAGSATAWCISTTATDPDQAAASDSASGSGLGSDAWRWPIRCEWDSVP